MIITLKGADFSKNNIGPLSSWLISREIGDGARYSGPAYVVKGLSYNASVVIGAGYRLSAEGIKVYMGDVELENVVTFSEDNKTLIISIAEVTGNIFVKVATESAAAYYTITYKYVDVNGNSLMEDDVERVLGGTERYFSIENAPAVEWYEIESVSPTSVVINSDITVIYTYNDVRTNNIMPIARYFINPYLKEGLLTTGSAAHRSGLFYLPTDSTVTFDTDYAATRTDFTFLAKYTSGNCDEVEQIILQTPSAKEYTNTFELEQGYYGVCWTYGAANANPTEEEMIITTPAISHVETTDIEATAEFVESKYLDATTGAIKNGSTNYAIVKFHLDKQYNGGINLYNNKASTRFSNLVKFTDDTYSTVEKVIVGPAAKALFGRCFTDLETGYYAMMIENSSGPSLDQCAISGYEYY